MAEKKKTNNEGKKEDKNLKSRKEKEKSFEAENQKITPEAVSLKGEKSQEEKKNNEKEKSKDDKSKESKKQIKNQNKLLKNILIVLGIFAAVVILGFVFANKASQFEYRKVDFKVVREGELLLYQTSLPVIYNGENRDYNFYLRNDPRKLEKVNFEGDLILKPNAVLDMEQDFNCGGKGVISIANMAKLFEISEVKLIRDENATCDSQGKYSFISIKEGNETKIEKTGPSCYELSVNNCQILEVTERFMVEMFVEINSWE